ncbi:hypothetical protein [Ilumatobacter nonamiensis]|uniref:hypothetical protein n=1 Tax=Ilumatobacter nonamiensis TaxID=467093 RepID=UPI000347F0C6|nr:hypothetical protein [Ilumatobacter nonamiensis]
MNDGRLQRWLDQIALTSWQRWALIAVAIASAAGASTTSALAAGHQTAGFLVLIISTACLATVRADEHTALITEVLIVWQWIATVDDVSTAWSLLAAMFLFVFHSTIAMMAVTPIGAVVGRDVARLWLVRAAVVMVATVAMWIIVVVLDQGSLPGNPLLTAAGLAVLAGLIVLARHRLAPDPFS